MKRCKYCGKEYSDRGIAYHERYCHSNPNRDLPKAKSAKWYEAMSQKPTENKKNQWSRGDYVLSEETRKKLRDSRVGKKLSQETKDKISKSRIEFLKQNPDKVPYKLNHYSKGRSYPEEYWKNILDNRNIEYVEQYQIGLYSLDFALVESKIDLEIDGDQHYLDKRIVESDKRRTAYLKNLGWRVVRVKWSDYQKLKEANDRENYVSNIVSLLI